MIKGYQNLGALESATVDAIETLKKEFDESWSASNRNTANLIAGEKEARNQMGEELKYYVIAADNRVFGDLHTFTTRGFWSRLNWLLTGR